MDDRNSPATKGDLADLSVELRAELRGELNSTKEQLSSEMHHIYNDLVERMSDSETRLLKAFYVYAEGNNKRVVEVEGNEAALRDRLGTLEDRVLQIEKRLNLPPAA